MPPCRCRTSACNGANRDKKTVTAHQLADKQQMFQDAWDASQRVISQESTQIHEYISTFVLADGPTNELSDSSGRLWTQSTRQPHYRPITDSLSSIRQIEAEVDELLLDGYSQLHKVGLPKSRHDLYPLRHLLQAARELLGRLSHVPSTAATVREAKVPVDHRLSAFLQTIDNSNRDWNFNLEAFPEAAPVVPTFRTDHHFEPILPGVDQIIQLVMFITVALQVILHLPRRGCQFLLHTAKYLVQLALSRHKSHLSSSDATFVSSFPLDPASVLEKWPLDGKETIFAVCPNAKCHKNYAPTYLPQNPIPVYPRYCTHRELRDGPLCSTRLTKGHQVKGSRIHFEVPIKRFVGFSFKDFMAGLLSRPGLEKRMDTQERGSLGEMKDVHDAFFLRDFTGRDGKEFRSTVKVGRHCFSICLDFFNPFLNKQAGKKSSIGMISIVCLSLPADLRYRLENMFLAGVIPGPSEPPLTAVGHYLTSVVDEFNEFWDPGVYFSRTADHPHGRLVECALILVVCDLLGARKVAGFASIHHNCFCSVCHCARKVHGINNTDYQSWNRRTNAECRAAAEKFLRSTTVTEQNSTFDATGVRFSELLRLPYFDVARCVVVDSMHNLFLGLIREHFQEILGIALSVDREEPVFQISLGEHPPDFSDNDIAGIRKLKKLLEAPALISFPTPEEGHETLMKPTWKALDFVCSQVGCPLPVAPDDKPLRKAQLCTSLLNWRLQQEERRIGGASSSTRKGHVLDLDDMKNIWGDMEKILTPSWMTSVPSNLGSKSHGKLKADQWRTLGTVHLPMSLIRIWGLFDPTSRRSVRCARILDVTMSLISATIIATSRTTSVEMADQYLTHMLNYLNGIKELFPEYTLLPNHHMSLHLHEFLTLFGPVHSWWTFPFERMIGALQRMSHNFKIGELEISMARAYTRSANLRAIVKKSGCPEVIRHAESIFQQLVNPQVRDSLQTDIRVFATSNDEDGNFLSPPSASPLPNLSKELDDAIRGAGIRTYASYRLLNNVEIRGLMYSTWSKHQGNACAIISPSNPSPARIVYIVQLTEQDRSSTYLAVRHHKPSTLMHDPFESYPDFQGRLWSSELDDLQIVPLSDVVSHFACLPLELYLENLVAVVPLWR